MLAWAAAEGANLIIPTQWELTVLGIRILALLLLVVAVIRIARSRGAKQGFATPVLLREGVAARADAYAPVALACLQIRTWRIRNGYQTLAANPGVSAAAPHRMNVGGWKGTNF